MTYILSTVILSNVMGGGGGGRKFVHHIQTSLKNETLLEHTVGL